MIKRQYVQDADMLLAISQGDREAFALFYDQYQPLIAFRAFRFLGSKEEMEDVVQEVFTTLWRQRTKVTDIQNISSYLAVLTKNSCLNVLKSNVRKQALEASYLLDQAVPHDTLFTDPSSEQAYYQWLDKAIDDLPSQQKKVYLLSRVERKKYLDIADEMKISKESVKKYLQLANQSIKNYLSRYKDSIVSLTFLGLSFL